jgi:7,8-dihydropterin-6-yl-methyl-4-(beta-D-ribofuranosyl)aminobenzene 5'-phosphate synthase
MTQTIGRRSFLRGSATVAGAALVVGGIDIPAGIAAPRVEPPVVDRVSVRAVLDASHDVFLGAGDPGGRVKVERTGLPSNSKIIHGEWGLSLHIESVKGAEQRSYMLDFGWTPDVLINNLDLLEVDPSRLNGLILSHGHRDHFGGLVGFLQKYRDVMPADLTLYTGGEDTFCYRHTKTPSGFSQTAGFAGVLDRRDLATQRVRTVLSPDPIVIDGHAFTSGAVPLRSVEKILPNTFEEYGTHDGAGCDASHCTPAELQGKIEPDQHWHEHATCFNVRDRGLVVVTSCGHRGIVNNIRHVQEITGIGKIHALVGGFHLGPAPAPYLAQVLDELQKIDLDYVIPMHCSGPKFVAAARERMRDKLIVSSTGSRFIFGM